MVSGTLVGAYRLVEQIGTGGMGAVWLAEHTMLGRRAAIKLLHPSYSSREDIVTRFFNEARAATAIADPGIVQIFDFGHHTDGSAYIVMELLEGEPLDKRLRRQGTLPTADALRIMRQVASSLGAAHARGIIHRDLKPENIYLVRDPEVAGGERAKILDFGIAKLGGEQAVVTQTHAMMGTPMYMSPEQCRGAGGVDQRSDVYSLGCVLFALIAGRPPFVAQGAGELIAMHLREAPPRLSAFVPSVAADVDDLVATCLEKDPARRFASAMALAAVLGHLVGSTSSPSLPGPSALHGRAMPTATTLSGASGMSVAAPSTVAQPRARRGLAIGLSAAVVLGGGIAAVVVAGGHGGDGGDGKQAVAAPTPAPAPAPVPAAPTPAPAPAPVPLATPAARVTPVMRTALEHFATWATTHAGSGCPPIDALDAPVDPWGHALVVTCTDQPSKQRIGLVSAGPDGAPGTDDDIASWQLPRELTALVAGAQWPIAAVVPERPAPLPAPRPPTTHKPAAPPPVPTAAQQQPPPVKKPAIQLDENGMPIHR